MTRDQADGVAFEMPEHGVVTVAFAEEAAAHGARDVGERGKRLLRIVVTRDVEIARQRVDVVDVGQRELDWQKRRRLGQLLLQRRDRPQQREQGFLRHRGAEQIGRDALRCLAIEIDGQIRIGLDIGRIDKDEIVHRPDHAPGTALDRPLQHKALLARIGPGHCQLERVDAQRAIDVALAEMDRERGAHEGGVERLAADQPGILHARIVGIEGQSRRAKQLQGIDEIGEHRRAKHAGDAGEQKTPQMCESAPHQNRK